MQFGIATSLIVVFEIFTFINLMLHKAITKSIKYLSQKEAQLIDEELMNPSKYGFSLDQLMEMAGMSVSHVVAREFPSKKNILIAVGPGNNGTNYNLLIFLRWWWY